MILSFSMNKVKLELKVRIKNKRQWRDMKASCAINYLYYIK